MTTSLRVRCAPVVYWLVLGEISEGIFVDCVDDILSYHNTTILFYFSARNNIDIDWRQVGDAFDSMGIYTNPKPMRFDDFSIFAYHVRAIYKGTWQLVWGTNRVYVVGTYSPFVNLLSDKFYGVSALTSIPKSCSRGPRNTDYWTPPYGVWPPLACHNWLSPTERVWKEDRRSWTFLRRNLCSFRIEVRCPFLTPHCTRSATQGRKLGPTVFKRRYLLRLPCTDTWWKQRF